MTSVAEVAAYLEKLAPRSLAESWDNVGLLIGDRQAQVTKVLVTLDVNKEVVDEALRLGANMIVAHHPVLFFGYKNLTEDNYQQSLFRYIVKKDINVYAAHTNLDNANGGMNDWLSDALGLSNLEILQVEGQYEGQDYGTGRIGDLPEALSLEEVIDLVKVKFQTNGVRYGGDLAKTIKRVAIVGGAAQNYYEQALAKGADLFITGDTSYHKVQDMVHSGLALIDPGHYIESICIDRLIAYFQPFAQEQGVSFVGSQILTDDIIFDKE